jgi:hypothetical protein
VPSRLFPDKGHREGPERHVQEPRDQRRVAEVELESRGRRLEAARELLGPHDARLFLIAGVMIRATRRTGAEGTLAGHPKPASDGRLKTSQSG